MTLKVQMWDTTKPIPYATNPRKISDEAVSAVAGSIKAFGFKSPIIVDRDGVIINGHTRLRAAQRLGLDKVPVVVADDLTPDQVRAYRLADNRVAEFSGWDAELLKLEIDQVEMDMDFADFETLMQEQEEEKSKEESAEQSEYTSKVNSPVYEIKGERPGISDLFNAAKTSEHIARINAMDIDETLKGFLVAAAYRHTVFDYGKIAEYYAHADADTQGVMEDLALVIIDFKRAIELGFVRLADDVISKYTQEYEMADYGKVAAASFHGAG
jgi:hypothetical protein